MFQYLYSLWVVLSFYGFPSIFACLVEIACSQLKKLKVNLKFNHKENCEEDLKECIKHHQMILQ